MRPILVLCSAIAAAACPWIGLAVKPQHYGIIQPALPIEVANQVRLRIAQALWWAGGLLSPAILVLALVLLVFSLRRGRPGIDLLIAASATAAASTALVGFFSFADFG